MNIKLHDPYEDKELSGFVTVINNFQYGIKLRSGDDLSKDKNMVPLKVAKLAAFYFIGTSSCP